MQTQSYAVQPCKLYFWWTGNRRSDRDGGRGGRRRDRKKKGVKSEKPQRARKGSAGGWDQLPPPRFDDVQRCPVGSVSVQAWRPRRGRRAAARWRGGEQEGGKEHVLPFYRGICTCAEHVCVRAVPAMRAAYLDKSILARPCATLCASAFLQVVVAVFFQRPARDDNGNVKTKPVCSGLLQVSTTDHPASSV